MKITDNHKKVTIELTYTEAEKIYLTLYNFCEIQNIKEVIGKKEIKLIEKVADGLDEYVNT